MAHLNLLVTKGVIYNTFDDIENISIDTSTTVSFSFTKPPKSATLMTKQHEI
jgi:hypothetical protein